MTIEESKPVSAPRAYEAVLHAIEAELRSGALKLGDQLPGERTLAERHGLSRASVRDAIRILDVHGVVRTSTGSGPNAGAVIISEPAAGLASALRLHVATRQLSVAEIVQTRILLETGAAEAATIDREDPSTRTKLDEAAALLDQMDDPTLGRVDFHALDARFHVLLSSLAGNAVIEAMMESLRLSISDYVAESVRSDEAWEPVAEVLRHQHHDILAAVSAGEGKLAARLLREHIEWFYAETQH
ncbi:FadR/GntR family transcriptional regulator [Zafaria sp. Z1313]|uniref:FadR/GntR family transcriptional regulator n=1 Tax=unclassified Zafaria TaxID=2828765 RepID=UPI002E79577B|nr:FCD domain-containing protein [Zafaria sp. J156]MEE1622714.1 FCD domain-containing protein [Zafaria sp. J156]